MLCRNIFRTCVRCLSTSTEVVPFNRSSPELIAKYLRFRNEGISKYRTISPLDSLLNETKKKIAQTLQRPQETPQRLSKQLSVLGIFSRNHAEEVIKSGIIYVDGKRITDPSVIIGQESALRIQFPVKFHIPLPLNLKLWVYHKPPGLTITRIVGDKRKSIFDQLQIRSYPSDKLFAAGKLDFLAKGILLLTNNKDFATVLDSSLNKLERIYHVRVYGKMFDEKVLKELRTGFKISGVEYGPYVCEIMKRGKSNTKLHIKMNTNKANELRRVFRKFSLRVNSLERISFGPYRVSEVPEFCQFKEVEIRDEVRHLMGLFYKEKLAAAVDAWNKRKLLLEGQKPKLIQDPIDEDETEQALLSTKIIDSTTAM